MITIKPLQLSHCTRLAELISKDEKLHEELLPSKPIELTTADEFYNSTEQWEMKTNSVCYTILCDDNPIGTISISHRDFENKSAKCGYWLESVSWGKGYATKAFVIAVDEAKNMGFKILTCSILKNNTASIALWKRQGAYFEEKDDRVIPWLSTETPKENWYTGLA